MRAYTVAATAVTLEIPAKWVDNVLSHYRVTGVIQARQGIARRLTAEAILALELVLRLQRTLELSTGRALDIAEELSREGQSPREIHVGDGISLSIDVAGVRSELAVRLAHAVEVTPSPRRGRPPADRMAGK
jgi:hypothetical protein